MRTIVGILLIALIVSLVTTAAVADYVTRNPESVLARLATRVSMVCTAPASPADSLTGKTRRPVALLSEDDFHRLPCVEDLRTISHRWSNEKGCEGKQSGRCCKQKSQAQVVCAIPEDEPNGSDQKAGNPSAGHSVCPHAADRAQLDSWCPNESDQTNSATPPRQFSTDLSTPLILLVSAPSCDNVGGQCEHSACCGGKGCCRSKQGKCSCCTPERERADCGDGGCCDAGCAELVLRCYRVGKVAGDDFHALEKLAHLIQRMVDPESWDEYGGEGSVDYYRPSSVLVVRNHAAVHAKITRFLDELAEAKADHDRVARRQQSARAVERCEFVPVLVRAAAGAVGGCVAGDACPRCPAAAVRACPVAGACCEAEKGGPATVLLAAEAMEMRTEGEATFLHCRGFHLAIPAWQTEVIADEAEIESSAAGTRIRCRNAEFSSGTCRLRFATSASPNVNVVPTRRPRIQKVIEVEIDENGELKPINQPFEEGVPFGDDRPVDEPATPEGLPFCESAQWPWAFWFPTNAWEHLTYQGFGAALGLEKGRPVPPEQAKKRLLWLLLGVAR